MLTELQDRSVVAAGSGWHFQTGSTADLGPSYRCQDRAIVL
jgi:hypothetical protein